MNISKAKVVIKQKSKKNKKKKENKTGEEGHDTDKRNQIRSHITDLSLTRATKRLTASSPSCVVVFFIFFVCLQIFLSHLVLERKILYLFFYYLIVWQHSGIMHVKCPLLCSEVFLKMSPHLHTYGHTAAASRVFCRNSLELWWLKYIVVYLFFFFFSGLA